MRYVLIDESVEKLAQWISPPQWKARYEETKDARDPDTCSWILEEPRYASWRSEEDEDHPFLFLHGLLSALLPPSPLPTYVTQADIN